jgi:hypothetical protein
MLNSVPASRALELGWNGQQGHPYSRREENGRYAGHFGIDFISTKVLDSMYGSRRITRENLSMQVMIPLMSMILPAWRLPSIINYTKGASNLYNT